MEGHPLRTHHGSNRPPDGIAAAGTTLIPLWEVKGHNRAVAFDRSQNVGLHHLALAVDGDAALAALHERLARRDDVEIGFAPEFLRAGPTRHMMVHIADGLRIEFIAVGAPARAAGGK